MFPFEWSGTSVVPIVLVFLIFLVSSALLKSLINYKGNLPPGPFCLPIVGYLPFLGKVPAKTLANLAETYGDILSLYLGKTHTVVLSDYVTMKEVISHPAALDRGLHLFEHVPGGIGFQEFNGPEWEEQRRFSMQTLKNLGVGRESWEILIKEELKNFISELKKFGGRPTDISSILRVSVASNIASTLFGRQLLKDKEKLQLLADCSEEVVMFTNPSSPATIFPTLRKILQYLGTGGYGCMASSLSKMSHFVREEILKHEMLLKYKEGEDFIHLYLERMNKLESSENRSQHYFSRNSLEGNLNILLLGGSDTIYNSLLWLFRLMAFHTDIQCKIHGELDSVFGEDEEPKFQNRNSVPFTYATVMEMERFASLVPLSTPRRATEDIMVRGFTIPKGTELVGNLWAIHHDPRYWDKPEEFRPERFLSADGNKIIKVSGFSPFSVGKRKCPGEMIAWIEMFLYFSCIMQKFEIKTFADDRVDFQTVSGLITQLKNPQKLCFVQRK